jgi:regulator of protease activity HflC (stomatin/prohibitin superfamily)
MPPPDENTTVDPTGTAWVVWLVIVGPGLVVATFACVRRVGPGELVLVVRQGVVARSRRNGFVARWPGLERFEPVPAGSRVLPLVVRARTRDDVAVIALAELTLAVHEVPAGEPWVPTSDAVRLAEDVVEESVGRLEVRTLVDDLAALEDHWPAQVTRLLPTGTEATALAVTEVEARLTGGAA